MLDNFSNYFKLMFMVSSILEWTVLFIFLNGKYEYKINKKYAKIVNYIIIFMVTQANINDVYIKCKIVISFISTVFYIITIYDINFIKAVKTSLYYWIFVFILFIVSTFIIICLDDTTDIYKIIISERSLFKIIVISKALLICILVVSKYINTIHNVHKFSIRSISIPIVVNLISIIFIMLYESMEHGSESIIFIIIYITLSSIALLFVIQRILIKSNEKITNEIIKERIEINYKSYKKLEQNYDRVRHIYHDLKHHIVCIKNYNTKDEILDYVDNLDIEIDEFEKIIETGNHTLDIILNHKKYICEKHKIKFNTYINSSKLDFISDTDICTIFSNALENAIEACKNIPSESIRQIDVKVTYFNSFCIIKFTNSKINEIKVEKGNILTTKSDIFMNGIGIKSIERVVSRYDGEVIINYYENEFILKIILPINNSAIISNY